MSLTAEQSPLGRIYTMDEVAQAMRMSRRALQDLLKKYPYYSRNGHKKLFRQADIEALWEAMRCPSNLPEEKVRTTGTSAGPSEASLYLRARELTSRKPQRKSASSGKARF